MRKNKRLSYPHSGISLLEVLAALFVVAIGLLCVLAVIPFGAYQVSQAQHAEYAANMIANACEEIVIREMGKKSWDAVNPQDCTKFVWSEPRPIPASPHHIVHVSVADGQVIMQGQDDLEYITYSGKRPDFIDTNGDVKIQSTGKYKWFFTFLPRMDSGGNVEDKVVADVLACYNRLPEDDVQVLPESFEPSSTGGTFTFSDDTCLARLMETKYVLVTWEKNSVTSGVWCKIVFLYKAENDSHRKPQIVVTGELQGIGGTIYVYIPSGVLYHRQIDGVAVE